MSYCFDRKIMSDTNKKIKVLFRHRSMEMGGVEKVLLSMLNNLDREKFDISLCLNLFQGELRNQIPSFIPYKVLAKGKEDFCKNRIVYFLQLVLRGVKLWIFRKFPIIPDKFILKNNADVEIATGFTMFSDVINSSNKKSKKIGWLHSDLTINAFTPHRERIFNELKQFDYIIYGSQQCRDVLREKYPELKLPEGEVVLNAIPIQELKDKSNEFPVDFGHVPTFVSVARLDIRKGQRTLLEAHKRLIDEGMYHQIILIGDGGDYKLLKDKSIQYGVEDTFQLMGTKMNPYPYVKNADFFVMPSESEGWPLIIAETLILQKPILATNVGGIPEMITHNENGYIVDYDVDSIYKGMKEFLTNKALISEIQKNLKDSEKQFDNQKIFDQVERIITKVYAK